jgi:HEAT repeat protein
MITKAYITELKHTGNGDIAKLIKSQRDVGTINNILESLGQLPANFESDFLYELLDHQHAQVRLNAVKNIGKLNGKSKTIKLHELYEREKTQASDVKLFLQ